MTTCRWRCWAARLVVAALLSGWLRSVFVLRSGEVGQAILFDLRRKGFDHAQALSVSFHEQYTSGRVISRLTSDVDTLTELLDSGLDGLLTAVFNSARHRGAAVLPRRPAGARSRCPRWSRWCCSTGGSPPRAAVAFRRTRGTAWPR